MEQRISLITLGVSDLNRARTFYERLGWQGQEVEQTVFFQAGGIAVVLWSRELLAEDAGVGEPADGGDTRGGDRTVDGNGGDGNGGDGHGGDGHGRDGHGRDGHGGDGHGRDGHGGDGFGGIALAHNVRSPAEVDQVLQQAAAAGAQITQPARTTFFGGYAGCFTDLDGHVWEIAYNPGFPLAADGSLTVPDLAST